MNTASPEARSKQSKSATPKLANQRAQSMVNAEIVRTAEAEAANRAALRQRMIADAAYFRAEQRGFEPGHELEDWLAAEHEVAGAQQLSTLSPCEEAGLLNS